MVLLAKDHGERVGLLKQYDLRYCFAHSPDGEELVLSDISFEREMLLNLVRDCLIVGAISLLLFFAISLLLSKWAIRPVEKAWIQQRQFVADASHELKTPLTVILTNAELLQRPQYGEEQKGTFTRNILTVSHQMKGLVEKLLELARVDAGAVKLSKVPLDLTGIISEAMLSFEVMFFEKGLSVTSDLAENVQVLGSEDHLRQMVEILLDNALKYSLPGETTVSLTGHGHHAVLRVSNPGQALSEEELRNIFKRFYRADSARSMNGSYGLGLPIAQGIVQEHGGKIKAQSAKEMTTFTVTIPLIK